MSPILLKVRAQSRLVIGGTAPVAALFLPNDLAPAIRITAIPKQRRPNRPVAEPSLLRRRRRSV